ncbi:glycoside hydrolase family protein [Aquicella lusitana]|uniref:Glycosyl hydrolase family 32 n=1 Tax=Aquicella lusitana TaxID=254246 RepID=A0A370GXG3_9COXI|nr:hypothetical protein [Aquicella lusitana]RDI48169.1 hypothetical protein C8D86_103134 [Aquicella lusitana]VVC72815.1 hypothetical protein AQULUS_05390 [Aquicella lusitana]
MKLEKIAHIELPHNRPKWMKSHLANPVVQVLDSSHVRVYCNIRNQLNQTHITYIDVDFSQNYKVTYFHEEPLLSLGPVGAFDDNGQSLGCIISHESRDYLYFLGWNLADNVPFRNSIGLASSPRGRNRFEKISLGPIMDRHIFDPFCLSYPFVLWHNGIYKMWYGSHKISGAQVSDVRHCIKYAESEDLIYWDRKNIICLDVTSVDIAFTRPFVMFEDGIFKMWYSYLRQNYRIGYAESKDGLNWMRMDERVGIDVSIDGWDSDMIEYPYVFDYQSDRYLAYCGNQFGKTGFGLAKFVK